MTKWLLSCVLVLVGAVLLAVSARTLWHHTGAFARTGVEESALGVVDLQALVSNHPSWKKLAWLDGEIQKMEEKMALSDRVIQEIGGPGGVKGSAGKLRDEALSGLMKIKSQRELMQRKLEKDAIKAASKLQALQARARQREMDELKQLEGSKRT
ncbi:MAG: hypothetical protein HYU64_00770 [Armatimonadetes bacterium]|nr:hypothetical protein [Armatimonadota bacterium]